MQRVTKYQVTTAKDVLTAALNNKERELMNIAEQTIKNKHKKEVLKLMQKIKDLNKQKLSIYKEAQQISKKLRKKSKEQIRLQFSYSTPISDLKQNDDEEYTIEEMANQTLHINYKLYKIDLSAQRKEIENYGLELILGTAFLEQLDKMVENINSIK